MTRFTLAAAAAVLALAPAAASAGPYSDDLGKCLVAASSPADQTLMVQWMFAAASTNPALKPLSALTEAQRDDYSHRMIGLYQRLLFKDCRSQTVAALKYEGPSAFEMGFEVLGQVAGRAMMGGPQVTAQLKKMGAMIDVTEMNKLLEEAGLPASAGSAKPSK